MNIITEDDALNIPSFFRLHWISPCPLSGHKQYRQWKNQPPYLITLANDMLRFGENHGKVKAGRINDLSFIVRRTRHSGAKLSYAAINKATCFDPLGSSSGL